MTKFGNYEVLRELGRGAMGVVYLARHASIGKLAAIKTIAPKHAGNAALVQRFFNEAKAAAGIGHPALIDVYDFGKDEASGTYLVMEYLQGETLGDRIKRGPLTTSLVVEIG